ncbi:MAG: hypothetical protein EXR35_11160 [Limnohabitans sp.]|nr:hypothetical protein [Limnohabitans sp.]
MKHCADIYAERCLKGQWLLFSVRDLNGKRKATISYEQGCEEWDFVQVCGTANRQASESVMEVGKVLNDPNFKKKVIAAQSLEPGGASRHDFTTLLKSEESRWGQLIKDSGVTMD